MCTLCSSHANRQLTTPEPNRLFSGARCPPFYTASGLSRPPTNYAPANIAAERKTSKQIFFLSLRRWVKDMKNNKCHYKKVNTVCKCLVIFVSSLMIGDHVNMELFFSFSLARSALLRLTFCIERYVLCFVFLVPLREPD